MMNQITSYKEVSPLIIKYFKRGVITNNFLTKEDYEAEISEGKLFYSCGDNFLNIYVKREDFYYLYFHALNGKSIFPETDIPLVCDVVTDCMNLMNINGFEKLISRVKLEIHQEEFCFKKSQYIACKNDAEKIFQLMRNSFDMITGYVPNFSQIENECEKGLFYVYKIENDIVAVLRTGKSGNTNQIKHLCVRNDYRGKGIARLLCHELLNNGAKCTVWTGKENQSAINLYKSLGFSVSPTTSIVYKKG